MKETKSNYCEHCGEFHDPVRDHASLVKVGEPVPDFAFEAYHKGVITEMSLSQLRGKWAVIVFYPADFTFVCPTELEELAKLYPKFQAANAEVISVSTDTVHTHKAWHDVSPGIREIKYPMAADPAGILRSMEVSDNSIGRKGAETLRKLHAAQYVETHKGKVCPASWEPGDDTLEPGLNLVGKL